MNIRQLFQQHLAPTSPAPVGLHIVEAQGSRMTDADGKSYINPPASQKSSAYTSFVSPITNGIRGGFEYVPIPHSLLPWNLHVASVHIYFQQNDTEELTFATELWERIRRECMSFALSFIRDCADSGLISS